VDPKLFFLDPDPAPTFLSVLDPDTDPADFQKVSDPVPDPTLNSYTYSIPMIFKSVQ
jgi:hypothetical protein